MKRLLLTLVTVTSLAAVAAGSAIGAGPSQITIRHQMHGCHSWSYNGGASQAALVVRLHPGATLTVKNVDVMPHTFVQTAGPVAVFQGKALLNKIGAQVGVRFPKAGTYAFKTRAGDDYKAFAGVKTTGEDNKLTLKVIVS
jgi:plastocyanin